MFDPDIGPANLNQNFRWTCIANCFLLPSVMVVWTWFSIQIVWQCCSLCANLYAWQIKMNRSIALDNYLKSSPSFSIPTSDKLDTSRKPAGILQVFPTISVLSINRKSRFFLPSSLNLWHLTNLNNKSARVRTCNHRFPVHHCIYFSCVVKSLPKSSWLIETQSSINVELWITYFLASSV